MVDQTPTLFLDRASLDLGDLDFSSLEAVAAPLQYFEQTTPGELATRALDAWCVITNKVVLDHHFFANRPRLKLVCLTATGTNNVDLLAASEHGVTVVNCQGYSTETVAQHTLMLILTLTRNLPHYQNAVAGGDWSRSPFFCLIQPPIIEAADLRLGVVGHGEIGQEVERLARALGMEVFVAERPGRPVRPGRIAFEDLLSTCNLISLHCPLTAESERLIDENALRQMRRDAILINTARGGLVDESALLQALRENWIAGAALDVLTEEPPGADHPLLQAGLRNLIVTPHCAWASRRARQRALNQTAENIQAWRRGQALRRV